MENQRPLILITNDDSINAPGIFRLVDCMPQNADVIVVAPAAPQSGKSSAISVSTPLFINKCPEYRGASVYTVNGTPVDCVKLALGQIVPRRPYLVLAGINHGSNAGCNVVYSGTMGAVIEGCIVGITSCGFSLTDHAMDADFKPAMPFIKEMVENLLKEPLPSGVCLNVNIPNVKDLKGLKVCRAARGHWTDEYATYTDPNGKPFYWLTGRFVNQEPTACDTDEYWMSQQYISAVPTVVDMSAIDTISVLAPRFDK